MKRKAIAKDVICAWCGETIDDPDEAANPRMMNGEIICERSWRDNFAFECCVCENWEENELQSTHLVVIDSREAFGTEWKDGKYRVRRPRGLYEVLQCPYFAAPLIGQGHLWPEALKRIGPVPKDVLPADYYPYPCGHLCRDCLTQVAPKLAEKIKEAVTT